MIRIEEPLTLFIVAVDICQKKKPNKQKVRFQSFLALEQTSLANRLGFGVLPAPMRAVANSIIRGSNKIIKYFDMFAFDGPGWFGNRMFLCCLRLEDFGALLATNRDERE